LGANQGVLTSESVATAGNADALVTSAYAAIGNDEIDRDPPTNGFVEVCDLMMLTKGGGGRKVM
jgi:hypothetical protein